MKKKKILKPVQSLERQIKKQKKKLAKEKKNYVLQDYCEKEIEQFEVQRKKLKSKLGK